MSVAPLLISAVASGHLKLNKFYFVFLSDWYNTFELSSDNRIIGYLMMYVYLGDGNTGDAPYAYLKYVEINLQSMT